MRDRSLNIRLFLALLMGGLLLSGCQREAAIPNDSFRLTTQDIISVKDLNVSLLTIHVSRNVSSANVSISLKSDHMGTVVSLDDAPEGGDRQGTVVMSATRIVPAPDEVAYIQILFRTESNMASAGGPSTRPVPADTAFENYFSNLARPGIYKLDAPITIAQIDGKPVTLTVGRPKEWPGNGATNPLNSSPRTR